MAEAAFIFRVDRVGLFNLLRSPRGLVSRDLVKRAKRVQRKARILAPKRTGRLAASIEITIRGGVTGISAYVGSRLYYAKWQHDGVGIYGKRGKPIRAKGRKKLLKFTGPLDGATVYVASVPGYTGTHYLTDALRAVFR